MQAVPLLAIQHIGLEADLLGDDGLPIKQIVRTTGLSQPGFSGFGPGEQGRVASS